MPYLLPILLAVAIPALVLLGRAVFAGNGFEEDPVTGKTKAKGPNRAILIAYGTAAENLLGWKDLHKFLDVTALRESGWVNRPRGEVAVPGSNAAVGPYQIRPTSSGDGPDARGRYLADPSMLQEPGLATVAIVDFFADNLANHRGATWTDLRTSAAFPFFIRGRPQSVPSNMRKNWTLPKLQKRYDDAVGRFHKDLKRVSSNLDPNAQAWADWHRVNFEDLASAMKVAR